MRQCILVVDDETELRDLVISDLRRKVYDTHGAGGGDEAWDRLRQLHADLVISDVRMAKGDGLALLRRLREEYPRQIPVILMTGFADTEDMKRIGGASVTVIAKPFQRKALHEAIVEALARSTARP